MASGNGCFTAFIKACSSQHRVFPLKFSSMNLAIRGHYGPRFQGTVEHCIIWLVLLIKWNTAPFAPNSLPSLFFCHFSPAFKPFRRSLPSPSSPYLCTSLSPALQHACSESDKRPYAFPFKNNDLPLVFSPPSHPLPHPSSTHAPLPLLARDINQLRWKFHNCACWEGFEQNCTMNFLKGIFTSCSVRLGRRRKVRPWGFMGLDSSLLK